MDFKQAVVFQCENEEYAVPIEQVVFIEKVEQINPVPNLPQYLLGFKRIRGELVPILDFNRILYNKPSEGDTSRIIVLNTDVVNYGLVVTEAKAILNFSENELVQVGLMNYSKTRYFTAVANLEERMITCVDPKILVDSLEGIREILEYLHKMLENEKEVNA